MNIDDVRFFADFSETEDEIPEGESEPTRRPAPSMPEFELEDISF